MKQRKNITTLSRNFVIPAGSQVVLKVEKRELQNDNVGSELGFKKPGAVGVVVKCPPHNDELYTIRFHDGAIVESLFDEIVLRRQEVDNLLAATDDMEHYSRYVIYKCQTGSKAYGLSNENSDDDIRGIFLPPAEKHWSLFNVPQQLELMQDNDDVVFWELEKFLRLALKANPNVLETLWTPMVLHAEPIAVRLREIRNVFLSKHLYKTYSGYVLSQFRRMRNSVEKTDSFKQKHAMHLIRLLYSGIAALRDGEIMVDVSDHREQLLSIRNGEFSFDEVEKVAMELEKQFSETFETTSLPDQPDFETVDRFLIEARRSMVQ